MEENRTYRLHSMMEKAGDSIFINMREVVNRYQLKQGRYVVIPSTYDPNEAGNFMIRIFTEKSSNARYLYISAELIDQLRFYNPQEQCCSEPSTERAHKGELWK